MEALDDFWVKTLLLCGFRGVDKVIFDCYNEVAPRKIGAYNWIKKDVGYKAVVALQESKDGQRRHDLTQVSER